VRVVDLRKCPEVTSLQRLLLGTLGTADTEQLENHIAQCDHCGRSLDTLMREDNVLHLLSSSATGSTPTNHVQTLIERLKNLPSSLPADATPTTTAPSPESRGLHDAATPEERGSPEDADIEAIRHLLAPPESPDEIGRLGPYRIRKLIGMGGMGVVFEADDLQLQRGVALKVIRPGLANHTDARQRFLREARAMAAIEHDHIAVIHHAGEEGSVLYLVMPLLKGETLEMRLQREGKLPITEVVRIGKETAKGLAAAHARGLIHRDIKPGNLWLEEGAGRVKILDFGLAQAVEQAGSLTGPGLVVGTPAYMAPEQAGGTTADARTDLFGLGCLLYRCCTGELPFHGETTLQVLRSLELDEPRPPNDLNPDVPSALSALILQLLAKDRAQRPPSAQSVVDALDRIEHGSPILQASVPVAIQPPALSRRRLLQRVAAAIVVFALLGIPSFLFGPAVYRFATDQGQLAIETDDPDIEIVVKQRGQQVQILDGKTGRSVTLKAGNYDLAIQTGKPGLELSADRFTLRRGQKQIVAVRWSPVVTHAEPQQIAVLRGHQTEVGPVACSADGKQAVTGSFDGKIVLWDIEAAKKQFELQAHLGWVASLALAPDASQALSAGSGVDRTVRLWDLQRRQERLHLRGPDKERFLAVAYLPDGARAVSDGGGDDNTLRLWDIAGRHQIRTFVGHTDRVWRVAFSGDGRRLVTGSRDRTVRVWDLETGEDLRKFEGHTDTVRGVAISFDGRQVLSGSEDGTVRLWSVDTGGETVQIDARSGIVEAVALSPNGRRALSGGHDGVIHLWDLDAKKELFQLKGHSGLVANVIFTPDGSRAISTGADGTVRVWRLPR
jgi:eukaryotic-like serine/threonine-protein kinase